MAKIRTLNEYANLILKYIHSPAALNDLQIEMAAKWVFVSEGNKTIKVRKAAYWQKKYDVEPGKKPLSEAFLETQWDASEDGIEETRRKIEMDGLDKLIKACQSALVNAAVDARNNR